MSQGSCKAEVRYLKMFVSKSNVSPLFSYKHCRDKESHDFLAGSFESMALEELGTS